MIWNAQLYDGKHEFVSKFGEDVVSLLAPKAGETILDLGCGTGDLSFSLFSKAVHVVGIDQSASMIEEAKQKYPDISFLVEDAHDLPFEEKFDAVFSNAALHWMKKPEQVLAQVFKSLKPGGRFVAEFGAKGNVMSISRAIIGQINNYDYHQYPWFFPSIGEYSSLMEQAGFHVAFAEHFERPTRLNGADGMRNWINMFGDVVMGTQTPEERERITAGAVAELKKEWFYEDHWIADYWRIRVVGVKK
ncbi:class I SAM-dependent methyltransferase [Domibacillus robiginosus]|uniref:class I SAM-dependent methyltransferase n=1 Tax=Domibacillus robiginosus TaxID=1071054 RepID=UPI000A58FA07|nr:class I SAM-dependent methyltransferase [Domibacillus robiginosus]